MTKKIIMRCLVSSQTQGHHKKDIKAIICCRKPWLTNTQVIRKVGILYVSYSITKYLVLDERMTIKIVFHKAKTKLLIRDYDFQASGKILTKCVQYLYLQKDKTIKGKFILRVWFLNFQYLFYSFQSNIQS